MHGNNKNAKLFAERPAVGGGCMKMNRAGQAAIADALYFLAIVAGLATMLFVFSTGYGLSVAEATGREYRSDFATSAMKTILYSSTPRNPQILLDDSTEVDYLLAVVKEDYADDGKIDESLGVVRDNLVGIMEPLADNFDYMFYLYIPDKKEFPVLMLYLSKWAVKKLPGDKRRIEIIDPKEDVIFFCSPQSLDNVDFLLTSLGTVYQSNSRIQLVEIKEGGRGYNTLLSQVNLSMWAATALPENALSPQALNCNPACNAKKTKIGETTKWIPC